MSDKPNVWHVISVKYYLQVAEEATLSSAISNTCVASDGSPDLHGEYAAAAADGTGHI